MPHLPPRATARDLHPVAWWGWALGLGAVATALLNPYLLALLVLLVCVVVVARRGDHPWARAFGLYLVLGAAIVVLRVLFRVVLGGDQGSTELFWLPEVPLPSWAAGVSLLGPVTLESVLAGLYDGLRLAALVICVGAANALANPKRLLRSMPAALYEVGTALVVAVSLLPQLGASLRRVQAARRLRGVPGGRVARLRGVVVPVLEDALERSLSLAASMDARGYGRSGSLTRRRRTTTGTLLLGGLLGLCVGVYAVLDPTAPRWMVAAGLLVGTALAVGGFWSAGRRVTRTRYRSDPWRWQETVVVASGVATALGTRLLVSADVRTPVLGEAPLLSLTALVVLLVAALPALVAPLPPVAEDDLDALLAEEVGVRAGAA